jgi:hypothetical protein
VIVFVVPACGFLQMFPVRRPSDIAVGLQWVAPVANIERITSAAAGDIAANIIYIIANKIGLVWIVGIW